MHICKNIIALCAMAVIAVSNCSNSTPEKKFRIGFEFQTAGSIVGNNVPWEFQKVPLFEVFYKGKKLWHIEIDGGDIEFVTAAFANDEEGSSLLEMCGSTITEASKMLRDISKTPNKSLFCYFDAVTCNFMRRKGFKDFEVRSGDVRINNPVYFCDKEKSILVSGIGDNIITIHVRPEDAEEDFRQIAIIKSDEITCHGKIGLEKFINEKLSTCVVCNLNEVITYLQKEGWEVKIKRNNKPDISQDEINKIEIRRTVAGWNGIFQPHVTIQMPLEKIVDVYDSLFDYRNYDALPDNIKNDIKNIKCIKEKLNSVSDLKMRGLIFLHAYTMKAMSSFTFENLYDNIVKELVLNAEIKAQFDAKSSLLLMSRRPFSEMFKDISIGNTTQKSIDDYQSMYLNKFNEVTKDLKLEKIDESGYGIQLLDTQQRPVNIRTYIQDCNEHDDTFKKGKIDILAEHGVLCPSTIKYLKNKNVKDVLMYRLQKDCITQSILTPEKSVYFDVTSDLLNFSNNEKYDLLSPPALLTTQKHERRDVDSMGSYKESREYYKIREYGEAIVEFRGIHYALPQQRQDNVGKHLSTIENISNDMLKTFNCVNTAITKTQ